MKFLCKIILLMVCLLGIQNLQAQTTHYVKANASGSNNGTSWADAYTFLQDALAAAGTGDEIWVAAGTYYPDRGAGQTNNDRNATFQLKNGVAIYGGFAGTETTLAQRDWNANITRLSGDIAFTNSALSYHVVTGSNTNNTAVLDGFTIWRGDANGTGSNSLGGGMYNSNGSPTISNCVFHDNEAEENGGGMYNANNSSPTLSNTVFFDNDANEDGGGMYNINSSPTIINSRFSGNSGSGMYNSDNSSPTIINSTFSGNTVGMYNSDNSSPTITNTTFVGNRGRGMYNELNSSPTIINSTFSGNSDGGMYNDNSSPNITNCTFAGNTARNDGGGMYNINTSSPTITNSIIWNNAANGRITSASASVFNDTSNPTFSFSLIANSGGSGSWDTAIGADAGNNIDIDPLFVRYQFPGQSTTMNARLLPCSPAIDAGSNAANTTPTDLDGNPRIFNSGTIDLGAFEFQDTPSSSTTSAILYVDASATGTNEGTSWANAFTSLQDALNYNVCAGNTEIWVAAGTYYPDEGAGQTDNDRTSSFVLRNDVALYGGFSGTETQRSDRDWVANLTILSGEIRVSSPNFIRNSYHVVINLNTTNTTVLDGFTISGGFGIGRGVFEGDGGGMYNINSSPTITNCTFSGNWAGEGGGMYNDNSSPTITNCIFSGNRAGTGGGMYNINSSPTITNTTFAGNRAGTGGGMYNIDSSPTTANSIIWNNHVNGIPTTASASVFNDTSNPTFSFSLIANSGGSGSWNAAIGTDGGNNIDMDPAFVAPQVPELTSSGSYRLLSCSPAINAGSNAANTSPTDLDNNPRIFNSGTIDLGAYEFQGTPTAISSPILYVDASATGTNEGTSWANAFTSLQDALNLSSCSGIAEIWVAAGTYYPDEGTGQTDNDRNATFQLKNNVAIYGGFAGTETALADRDWATNLTILSGDIDGDGMLDNNAYTVVTGSFTTNTAVLDGFTISGGNADVDQFSSGDSFSSSGSGMYNLNGSPTIANCIFSGNWADYGGGGMYNSTNSSPTITNCTFSGNRGEDFGGGIYNINGSSPTITNTTFSGNEANVGGGMSNNANSSPTITNTTFSGNSASRGGGMDNIDSSSPIITNSTLAGNTGGGSGGGMYNSFNSSPIITNSIIWNNSLTSAFGSDAFSHISVENFNSSNPTFSFCLIAFSGGSGSWDSAIGTDGGNNIDMDPAFVAPQAPGSNPGGNYSLLPCSPAINAGSNAANTTPTDLEGNPRIFNSGHIDLGAYEFQHTPSSVSNTILYVDASATGTNEGTSWANAFTSLQDALNLSSCSGIAEIWVAAGTYYPDEGTGQTDNARTASFVLRNGVALYGGFSGTETTLADRDWAANVTILSGDIDGDGMSANNTYHVVTGSNTTNTAVLDGFTISGGNANIYEFFFEFSVFYTGGGMYNSFGSPTINNCIFSGNMAIFGGGMFNIFNSSPTITNSTFSGNLGITMNAFQLTTKINGDGGGMYNSRSSSPTISNSIFSGNTTSGAGGGMVNIENSSSTITNTTFSGNTASGGGGMYNRSSSPTIINSTFSGNTAISGGGMENRSSSPTLTNSIFWNNAANGSTTTESASIRNFSSNPTISYSLIANSGGSGSWNATIGTDGGNNIASDPLFVDQQAPGLSTAGSYRLLSCSPAINAGSNAANTTPTDLDGNPRIFNNATIDLGAYEFQGNGDNENPVANCVGNQTVETDASSCSYTHAGTAWDATATDNCTVASLAYELTGATTGTGSSLDAVVFNSGITTVTWTATDATGNTNQCSFTVTVEDKENPAANCVGNQTVETDASSCSYTHAGTAWDATATDNCTVASLAYELTGATTGTGSSLDAVVFNSGITTVTWTATDATGNTNQCSFTVTVEDKENPAANCVGNQTVETDASSCSYTHAGTAWDATATDNCTVASLAYELTGATTGTGSSLDGVVFNAGQTTVTWTATDDAGNTNLCSFTVTVEDNESPVITCATTSNQTIEDCSYTHIGTAWDATATDNCTVASLAYELTGATTGTGSSLDGVVFNAGVTTVTWTATDDAGNTNVCNFTVTVKETTAPVANCVGNQTPASDAGGCTYTHAGTVWDATATDNCTVASLAYELTGATTGTGSSLDGVVFNAGVTTVTWTATDDAGNTNVCNFTVTVKETTAPTVVCQAFTLQLDANGRATLSAADIDGGSSDACGIASITASQSTFDCSDIGANTVTLTVVDTNGNTATCTATVQVEDISAPSFNETLPVDQTVSCEAVPTAETLTATDNCGTATVTFAESKTNGSCTGNYVLTRTWIATDALGSETVHTQTITVEDTTAPVINTPPADAQLANDGSGQTDAIQAWLDSQAGAQASDACGSVTWTHTLLDTQQDCTGTIVYTYQFTASDACGNAVSDQATFTLSDVDREAPVLTNCPPAISQTIVAGVNEAIVTWTAPTATDTCGPVTLTSTHQPGDSFPEGTTTVTYTATDEAGNTSSCSFDVTVVKEKDPSLALVKTGQFDANTGMITYTFTITNTGDVTLTDVRIEDARIGVANLPTTPSTLEPGQIGTATATYTVTEEDIAAGEVINQATVTGMDPDASSVADLSGTALDNDTPTVTPVTCLAQELLANDDDFGDFQVQFGGVYGNILTNDRFEGQQPDPAVVAIEFIELDGLQGLLIEENGDLRVVPNVNEPRAYTLRYRLRDTGCELNVDTATVTFRLLENEVDLAIEKLSLSEEVYEGDQLTYALRISNIGTAAATSVRIVDDLPNGVRYLRSEVVSSTPTGLTVSDASQSGNQVRWEVPNLPAGAEILIHLTVALGDPGRITNVAEVSAQENDSNSANNRDTAITGVLPLTITNAITPNGDGLNETFHIRGSGNFNPVELVIFDRDGNVVHEDKDYTGDWFGKGLLPGVYFYEANLTDRNGIIHRRIGWIQLIKERE